MQTAPPTAVSLSGALSVRRARWWLAFLVLSLATLGILASLFGPGFEPDLSIHAEGIDDAYISYRFAQNLVAGHGLVFNPGERIEGFSNLLWVLLAALLLQAVRPENLHLAICGVNVLLAVAGLVVFYQEMRRRAGEPSALLAAALWAFYPFLWQWIGSGLETVAMVLLQLLIWSRLSRAGGQPAWGELFAYFSLAILLRADGFVLVALVAFHWLLCRRPAWALRSLLLGAPATLGLFAFRLFYYRDLWPSTYYVKIARGLVDRVLAACGYLGELLVVYLLAPFVVMLLWQAWRVYQELRDRKEGGWPAIPPELTLGFGILAYWLYVGGDVFKIRFLLVLFPFGLAVAFGSFAQGLARRHAVALALAMLAAYGNMVGTLADFNWQAGRYDAWIELGKFLRTRYPNAVLAADGVGKVPFFSGLYTIDMLGLCDAHISKLPPSRRERPGHEKSDPDYVLARRPDVIIGHLWPDYLILPGLDRDKYAAAGYRIAYLVNIEPNSLANPIIAAPATGDEYELRKAQGYRYAVLLRQAPPE